MLHQVRPKEAMGSPFTGATDVDIDLVVSRFLTKFSALSHQVRITPTYLKGHGMLRIMELKKAVSVTIDESSLRDHLGIEYSPLGQDAQKGPLMAVCPTHHGSDRETPIEILFLKGERFHDIGEL